MKNTNIQRIINRNVTEKLIICIASVVLLYLISSLYFSKHFFFNTVINGVNVSLKAYENADDIIRNHVQDYKLRLIERNGETEEITGQDIGIQYNVKNDIFKIYQLQNPFLWISSIFKDQSYYVKDLYHYNKDDLNKMVEGLTCLDKKCIESHNVSFYYSNSSYKVIQEVYGNIINKENFKQEIKKHILHGEKELDLNAKNCYDNPKYTISSNKTLTTKNLLNKYVATNVTYKFGDKIEIVDQNIINLWLSIDENLEIQISKNAIMKYIKDLSKKYNTVGITRSFKTSTGKTVEVKGGLYGWKINLDAEAKSLFNNIKLGVIIKKEPIYSQKAIYRKENDVGNTYIEINITRQHLWFYKEGKLITQGSVVTGNPYRGNSTVVGTYMIIYKQKEAVLKGPGYEAKVTYWMPFYGNIGLHDAKWRYSFGGEIYKMNGTHGCVNAPLYLAKKIFENIEEGIPIISYEE